jgi:hypothetical protein
MKNKTGKNEEFVQLKRREYQVNDASPNGSIQEQIM